jgi:hypothetical protein
VANVTFPSPAVVEKAPAQDKEAQAAIEGAPKVKTVPHETFHAEREEHKKTKAELPNCVSSRLPWTSACAGSKPPSNSQPAKDDTPPDPNVDVFAALKWTQDKLLDQQEQSGNETRQQQEARENEQRQEQQVWTYWQQDAANYTKENPDFGNAAKWLSEYRDKQLSALSIADSRFSTPQSRNAQIETELKGIIIPGRTAAEVPGATRLRDRQGLRLRCQGS